MGVDYVGRWESAQPGRFFHTMQWDREALRVTADGETLVDLPLGPLLDRADTTRAVERDRSLPPAVMRLHADTPAIRIAAYVTSINGRRLDGSAEVLDLVIE